MSTDLQDSFRRAAGGGMLPPIAKLHREPKKLPIQAVATPRHPNCRHFAAAVASLKRRAAASLSLPSDWGEALEKLNRRASETGPVFGTVNVN